MMGPSGQEVLPAAQASQAELINNAERNKDGEFSLCNASACAQGIALHVA